MATEASPMAMIQGENEGQNVALYPVETAHELAALWAEQSGTRYFVFEGTGYTKTAEA